MTILLLDGENGDNDATVYLVSFFHQQLKIRHEALEELFLWLYNKTNAGCLRDAVVIIYNVDGMSNDDWDKANLIKKLYSCFVDGRIKPQMNIFSLYEDIAQLAEAGIVTK